MFAWFLCGCFISCLVWWIVVLSLFWLSGWLFVWFYMFALRLRFVLLFVCWAVLVVWVLPACEYDHALVWKCCCSIQLFGSTTIIMFSYNSGSVGVTAYDSESGRPSSNPEWGLIYYEAPITAHGVPEPSSLRGSTLGTRAAEHKGCNWACKLTDGCSLKKKLCSATTSGIWHRNKVKSTACSASVTGLRGAQ